MSLDIVPLPKVPVSLPSIYGSNYNNGPGTVVSPFNFKQLAHTLLRIGGAANGLEEEEEEEQPPTVSEPIPHPHLFVSPPTHTHHHHHHHHHTHGQHHPHHHHHHHHHHRQSLAAAPLPSGMQMLCSVAWDSVHSPTPAASTRMDHIEEEKTQPSTPIEKVATPALQPLTNSTRKPIAFKSNRFSTYHEWSDDSSSSGSSSSSSSSSSDDDEDGNTLNGEPGRMQLHSPLTHLSRAADAGADSRLTHAQDLVNHPSQPHLSAEASFHDTSHFTLANQYEPYQPPHRATSFRLSQPQNFGLDESDEDEVAEEEKTTKEPEEQLMDHQSDIVNDMDDAQTQLLPPESTALVPYAPRNLELEYEHLQHALHQLQLNYTEQLAAEVRYKMQELDVALSLAVGIEPPSAVMQQLTQPSPSPSPTHLSSLIQRSRQTASQYQVQTLGAQLSKAQHSRLTSLQEQFQSIQANNTRVYESMRAKFVETEAKISHILHHNHAAVTKIRDDALKAAAEKRRLELEAEAERKRIEEARIAAEKKAAEEKAAAEKKAEEEKQAAQAAADKAKTDAAAKLAADKAKVDAAKAAAAGAPPGSPAGGPAAVAIGAASPAAGQEMAARMQALTSCRATVKPFVDNPAQKNRRLQIMMLINKTVAQIVGTQSQVQAKATVLTNLLTQSQQSSREEYAYCLETIANKFVTFTKSKVRLQNSAAFPFAMVALIIAMGHPSFTDIFLASLGEKCTYITPQYLERKNYPSMPAYMIALGYEEQVQDDSAQVEGKPLAPTFDTEEQYLERMVGYVCMYGAFVELPFANHPHGQDRGWIWLARVLNQKPRTATASILYAFLSTAGYSLFDRYPNQMRKLLHFINTDYILRLDATTPPRKAAQAVLALWLQTTIHQISTYGKMQPPEGRNMPMTQESEAHEEIVQPGD